jgi:hypothetical protein
LVRDSAMDLEVRNIAELRTKIADAHLWLKEPCIWHKGDQCSYVMCEITYVYTVYNQALVIIGSNFVVKNALPMLKS